jgi:hypothetical protein
MPYELRAKGRAVQTFDTEDEAVAGARREQGMARGSRPQGRLLTPSVRWTDLGAAVDGLNTPLVELRLAVLELSEPARRFRDHHPLTAFQQIAARRSKPPMSCHARGSHGRALPARVRSPLPFPKRGSRGPLRLFRVPGAKPGGRGGSGFHPAMDRVHSWCRGSREQPAQFHRTRQLATLLEGGANLRLLPREQRTCRQAERGRQASGRRTGPR